MQSRCCSERSKYDTDANLLKGSKTDEITLYGAAFASDGLTNNNLDHNFLSGGSKGLQRWQWVQVDTPLLEFLKYLILESHKYGYSSEYNIQSRLLVSLPLCRKPLQCNGFHNLNSGSV